MQAGFCRYIEVIDGTLDLADIATMNELIDVRAENEERLAEHAR